MGGSIQEAVLAPLSFSPPPSHFDSLVWLPLISDDAALGDGCVSSSALALTLSKGSPPPPPCDCHAMCSRNVSYCTRRHTV